MLGDGRIVALSERLRSLVDDGGIVAEYDSLFSEVGKRGLEGLAIRPLAKQASRIAVLWEGWYPDTGSLPSRLRTSRAPQPLLPLVLVHDLAAHGRAGRLKLANAVSTVELDVPHLPGEEPAAQRFRAPDLVWTRMGEDWGFIVLITSQSAGPNPSYDHHWLQRFTSEGKRFGEPLDLAKLAPAAHAGANWEGLCWLEAGRTLIVVHEAQAKLPAAALVVELPAEWQCAGEGL